MVGAAYANVAIPSIPYWAWVLIIGWSNYYCKLLWSRNCCQSNLYLVGLMAAIVVIFVFICGKSLLNGVGEGTLLSIKPFYNENTFSISTLIAGGAIACFFFSWL